MGDYFEIKDRILTRAGDMFLKSGYSRVTIEEIAANLGMSKKSLYKYFPSKEELVKAIISKMRYGIQDSIEGIISNSEMGYIEKLDKLMNLIRILSAKFEGPLLEDLYKNVPELWEQIIQFKDENIVQKFIQLINSGAKKGIFRKDIDHRLIVLIYLNAIKGLMNYEILAQIPFTDDQVYETINKVIFTGIFTEDIINKNLSK